MGTSIKKEGFISYGDNSIKTMDEESMLWPFQRISRFTSQLEKATGTFLLILFLNCLLLAINFLLYGNFEISSLGENYFIRSVDPFLEFEATRVFFKENLGIENIALPFLGHLVNKGFILLGLNYTREVFYVISVLPYFVFMVMFSYAARRSIGLVGALAIIFALHSSGIIPYMLSWGGYVDGVSYLILLLAFLSINKSFLLTLLWIVVGSLNHNISVLGISAIAFSMFIIKPRKKFVWIMLYCLVILFIVNLIWNYLYELEGTVRTHQLLEKFELKSLSAQAKEVYGVFPWNFLSPLKLMTIPMIYFALLLFKRRISWGLGYIFPMVFGVLLLLAVDDVTRILTHFFIISFFMMIASLSGSLNVNKVMVLKLDSVRKRKLYKTIVLCSFLSIFIPNYYVDNGKLHVPNITSSSPPKLSGRKTVTAHNRVRIDTVQSKFGDGSARFSGGGDRLQITDHEDWAFGLRDFTIDFWMRFASTHGTQVLVGYEHDDPDKAWLLAWEEESKSLKFLYSIDGKFSTPVRFPWTPSAPRWYHIAAVRKGSDLKIFVDGTQIGITYDIGSLPIYNSIMPLLIGSRGIEEHFTGWLDEIRISKGVARWTSDFTPPSSEYEADSYTKLLLHFRVADHINDWIDIKPDRVLHGRQSGSHTVAAHNMVQLDIFQRKFGDGSARFHGEGDRLQIPDHDDWAFSSEDITIDFWIRFANISGTQMIVGQKYYSPDRSWQIAWEEERKSLLFSYSTEGRDGKGARFPWSPSTNTWYHIAFVRNGSDLEAFVNGSIIGSKHHMGDVAINDSTDSLYIGSRGGHEEHFNGWIDEIRISKGVARWTSDFTPPSSEYEVDSYTKLLLHCN